jgi:hypothetical protein
VRLLKKGRRHICRRPICLRLNDAPGEGTGDFVAKRHDEGRSSRGTVVWALRDVDELGVHVIVWPPCCCCQSMRSSLFASCGM